MTSTRAPVRAVIFDLDGVIVSTDELHYRAWKEIADALGIPFDRDRNVRLRGVSRMDSLELLLGDRAGSRTAEDKAALATRKNARYRELLGELSPGDVLPGVAAVLVELRARHVLLAVGSSSRNTEAILERVGLTEAFDAVADGTRISRSKPDPEVFLLAAADLGVEPSECLVVEDADAGVTAARAAGMRVVGVGAASANAGADDRLASAADLLTLEALAEARP